MCYRHKSVSAHEIITVFVKTLSLITLTSRPCHCINIVIKFLGTRGSDQKMFLRDPLDVATISTHAKQHLGRLMQGDVFV